MAAGDNMETQAVNVLNMSPPLPPPAAVASPSVSADVQRAAYQSRPKDLSSTLEQVPADEPEVAASGEAMPEQAATAQDAVLEPVPQQAHAEAAVVAEKDAVAKASKPKVNTEPEATAAVPVEEFTESDQEDWWTCFCSSAFFLAHIGPIVTDVSPGQAPTDVKTSREDQLKLKASSAGRGRGKGRGKGRGGGTSKPNDERASSSTGKRAASAAGRKGKKSKLQVAEDQWSEWWDNHWWEHYGDEWEMKGWEEPEKKAADAYAWLDGKVSLHKLATPQNKVVPESELHVTQEPAEPADGSKKRSRKAAADEGTEAAMEEPSGKVVKAGDAPGGKRALEQVKVAEKSNKVPVEDGPKEAEKPGKARKEARKDKQPAQGSKQKGKAPSKKPEIPQLRKIPESSSKQVRALMSFAQDYAEEAERDQVKLQMLPHLSDTVMCVLVNMHWKRPGFGVTSLNDEKDIAYFKFNWPSDSLHESGSEYAWRTMAAVAFKCADMFVTRMKLVLKLKRLG